MGRSRQNSQGIVAQQLEENIGSKEGEEKSGNGAKWPTKEEPGTRPSPGDLGNTVSTPQTTGDEPATIHEYATPRELALLSTVFTIATFMIAIDGSILGKDIPSFPYLRQMPSTYTDTPATAIPRITSDFQGLDDISWYGSAYLLTEMAFQPTFGRLYSLFDPKVLYLLSIIVCELCSDSSLST